MALRRLFPLTEQNDRWYTGVWQKRRDVQSTVLLGDSPAEHRKRGQELAGQGWRMVALSVAWIGEKQGLRAVSVWHRPAIAEADRDALAKQQANAALALAHLNEAEAVWPLLRQTEEPRVRTYLIHGFHPMKVDARLLVRRLAEESDVSARRALILSLGEYGDGRELGAERERLTAQLLALYRDDPDPGVHSAVDWLLRQRWGKVEALAALDRRLAEQPAGNRNWLVNDHGETLAVFRGPVEFPMGATAHDPYQAEGHISSHRKRIGRSFALATREISLEQFKRFLHDHPDIAYDYRKEYVPDDASPALRVSWYLAAQYCSWLSEQEKFPRDQRCYPSVADIEKHKKAKEPLPIQRDVLQRTGYRLPTEAEWEYACRAGAVTSRPYGHDPELLARYAWFMSNSQDRVWPGGKLKPNDFGMFDMLGNAWEWCHEPWSDWLHTVAEDDALIFDRPKSLSRPARGGSFMYHLPLVRTAARYSGQMDGGDNTFGFRIARTIQEQGGD